MIYNVVLISGVQQSDSVMHIHTSTVFQTLFLYRLLQSIQYSSLCYEWVLLRVTFREKMGDVSWRRTLRPYFDSWAKEEGQAREEQVPFRRNQGAS